MECWKSVWLGWRRCCREKKESIKYFSSRSFFFFFFFTFAGRWGKGDEKIRRRNIKHILILFTLTQKYLQGALGWMYYKKPLNLLLYSFLPPPQS